MGYDNNNSDEIYECRSSINYYQNQINTSERDKAAIQEKIDRLVAVRDSIAVYKGNINSEKNLVYSYKSDLSYLNDWTGTRHDNFMSSYSDILLSDYNDYYKQIDSIHDALNTEITRLQNSVYEMDGVLGWLRARLNDCWNWWNNLVN